MVQIMLHLATTTESDQTTDAQSDLSIRWSHMPSGHFNANQNNNTTLQKCRVKVISIFFYFSCCNNNVYTVGSNFLAFIISIQV